MTKPSAGLNTKSGLEQGIDTMSLNPDTVVETWQRLGRQVAAADTSS